VEKRTPHCPLSIVKTLIQNGKVLQYGLGTKALTGAAILGFDFDGMLGVVLALTPGDFHKSMTTHADHTVWQDVYRPTTKAGEVYLKLTVVHDVLIVSFKEL
jgi:motility quorum-sensing regulator/GCU-specific mRNA interferase toxin